MKMPCPQCGGHNTTVLETRMRRDAENVPYVLRRRKCLAPSCGERFVSYENRLCDITEKTDG